MAFPRLTVPLLLASFILLLYWTSSSADVSTGFRVKRELAFRRREEAQASLVVAKETLTGIKTGLGKLDTARLSSVIKGLSKFVNFALVIAPFASSVVNVALAFIPQENPLKELREQFTEVNRKLDSLSIQISNLATDVEWFNYVSVYSQDELRILNAWRKFKEFLKSSESAKSEKEKLRLAEIFTNYYENTGTEASVSNFYHYLTVDSTSLSENLNTLLKNKFKCDIRKIGKHNFYFSSLLWKGMVLNQLYWRLIGLNSENKDTEYVENFREVYTAQLSAVNYCLDNIDHYIDKDVEEISKALSHDDKQAVADQVKQKLDEKYYWYKWVVLVYNSNEESYYIFHSMRKVPVGSLSVALGYTQKEEENVDAASAVVEACGNGRWKRGIGNLGGFTTYPQCDVVQDRIQSRCTRQVAAVPIAQMVKVMVTTYKDNFVQVPAALQSFICEWDSYTSKIHVYYSRTLTACSDDACENGGQCKKLLDSNDHLCECPDGWRGDKCEEKMDPRDVPEIDLEQTVPDITSINAKLKLMEEKLEKILNAIENRPPAE